MNIFISLRWRIIFPLLLLALLSALIAVIIWQTGYDESLEHQLVRRAEACAQAVHYAANSAGRVEEIQAFVSRLGAERDVESIVVVADSPARVVAATSYRWQGMLVESLPANDRAELYAGLTRSAIEHRFEAGTVHLLMPFRKVLFVNGATRVERWVVLVHIRERSVAAALTELRRTSGAVLAGVLALIVLICYLLISRLIIRPLHDLELVARAYGSGDRKRRAPAGRRNEVEQLAGSFNELLDTIQRGEARLRESEERLSGIINNSTAVIFLKDCAGRYLLVNRRYEELFRVKNDDVCGKTDYDIFPRDKADALCANDRAILAGNRTQEFEEELPLPDGLHTYIAVKFPLLDETGTPCAIGGIATDITERKRFADRVRASEEKYRLLVETTGTGFLILDAAGRVLDANAEYVRLSGHGELREILGRQVTEWTAPYEREKNAAAVAECIRARKIRGLEIDYSDAAGNITPVVINASVEGEGAALRIISLVSDISSRRQAAAALRESHRRFDALLNTMRLIAVGLDRTGRIDFANPYLLELLGLPAAEVIGKDWFANFIPERLRPEIGGEFARLLTGGIPEHYENPILTAQGDERMVAWTNTILRDELGLAIGVMSLGEDITERKRSEEQVRQQLGELKRWHAVTLNREERVQELKRQVNQLLARLGESPRYAEPETDKPEIPGGGI